MITLQGILFDEKSSFQQGPASAPPLIRQAFHDGSGNYFAENGINTKTLIEDKGDFEVTEYLDIYEITHENLGSSDRFLTLGGDHSITYPVIKAFSEKYPKLDILHIDAHADLYQDFEGDPHSHACPFARIMESGLANRLVQVGIRTLNDHQRQQAQRYGVEIHEMKNLDLSIIGPFKNPVYISLDLDGLDPAFAPGVSHHEPGGLSTRQVIDLIQNLQGTLVGADIVEYNPRRDFHNMTAYVAAKMVKELVAKLAEN